MRGFLSRSGTGSWAGRLLPVLALAGLILQAIFLSPVTEAATAEEAYQAWWAEVQDLYAKAKEAGEKVPGDVATWFREEVRKIGAWEYRVVELQEPLAAELELRMNELGKERWDVFWVARDGKRFRLLLKRPAKSYLKTIPARDLLNLVPSGAGAAAN